MIPQFGSDSCLLLIDVQTGVNALQHWGGETGRRNNPDAEDKMHGRRLVSMKPGPTQSHLQSFKA